MKTQEQAVLEGLADLAGEDGVVHVHGHPQYRPRVPSRVCSEPDSGERVVFHLASTKIAGFYFCARCGETDGPNA